jgi:phage gp29-like protein
MQPIHTNDILQEKIKPIIRPVMTAIIASSYAERPSVETPLMIYASLDRVVVRIPGALSLTSNHPKCFVTILL